MAGIKKYVLTEPYFNFNCRLGEAPFFDTSRNILRFVDILGEKLHAIKLNENPPSHAELKLTSSIGTTADIEGDDQKFIIGGKFGFGIMRKYADDITYIKRWPDETVSEDGAGSEAKNMRLRSNDGAVDSKGRYWVGVMEDEVVTGADPTNVGVLCRLDGDLSFHRMIKGVTIPNGISWSRDDTIMYFTDSPTKSIMAYPYNSQTGDINLAEGRVFFTVKDGVPDGHCQDEEGCLWVANHGAARVWRVSPEGQILAEIVLPTRCVTCPAFVGTELFITTMAEVEPKKYPWSIVHQGALFKIDVGLRGRPLNKFKLKPSA